MAAVEGLLSAMNVEPVSLVNALLIAEERGIRHARKTGAPEPGFETTVGVSLETARGRARVAGALVGNSHGRVIRIDRSEEHTSELQSRLHLVCRLLLEKKKRVSLQVLQTALDKDAQVLTV